MTVLVIKAPLSATRQLAALDEQVAAAVRQWQAEWAALIANVQAALAPAQVEAWLETNRLDLIEAQVDETQAPYLAALAALLGAALSGSGTRVARQVSAVLGRRVAFDATTAAAVSQIRALAVRLTGTIGVQHTAAVRQYVTRSLRDGIPRRTIARRLRPLIGLNRRQEQALASYRTALETGDAAALDRTLRDRRFDATARRRIQGGEPIPARQVDRMVNRYRQRMVAYRARTIARQEAERAVAMGQHEAFGQVDAQVRADGQTLRRFWIHRADGRVRAAHVRIPSLNADGVAMNQSFTTPLGPLRYPHDPAGSSENTVGCRCRLSFRLVPMEEVLV